MVEKKTPKKRNDFDDSPVESNRPNERNDANEANEVKNFGRRFGAIAFVEDIADDDDEAEILSLDSLRESFAALAEEESDRKPENKLASETEEPEYEEDFTDELESYEPIIPQEEMESGDEQTVELSPRTILEAMLFVGDRNNRPLRAERAAEKMRNVEPEEIAPIVTELNRNYAKLGCPYTIITEADGYRMVLRPEFEPILSKFYGKIRQARLSQQAIDTLAVVAYCQPISAEDVQKLRKQPSASFLSQLVRRGLLETEQQIEKKKKITLYKTTERFLELFQLDSIDDLPISEEIDFR